MTRDEIHAEWRNFIEYPTEDRSTVTTRSALLFAEYIAARTVAREREACANLLTDKARHYTKDGTVGHTIESCAAAIRARGAAPEAKP